MNLTEGLYKAIRDGKVKENNQTVNSDAKDSLQQKNISSLSAEKLRLFELSQRSQLYNEMKRKEEEREKRRLKLQKLQEQQAKYDSMTSGEVNDELRRLAEERADFVKQNGGKISNTFTKIGSYLGGIAPGADQSGLEQSRAKAKENLNALDKYDEQKDTYEKLLREKQDTEYLNSLSLDDEVKNALQGIVDIDKKTSLLRDSAETLKKSGNNNGTYQRYMDEQAKSNYDTRNELVETVKKKGLDYDKLIDIWTRKSNAADAKSSQEEIKAFATEHPVAATGLTYLQNGGINENLIRDIATKAFGGDIDVNDYQHQAAQFKTNVRETVDREYASKAFGGAETPLLGINVGHTLYNAANAGIDSAINMAVAKGVGSLAMPGEAINNTEAFKKTVSALTNVFMSSEAAEQSLINEKQKGSSDGKALVMGLLSGAIEAATEKYSIDAILKEPKNIVTGILKGFAAEGSEEVASNVLNNIADYVDYKITGDRSDIMRTYDEYVQSGMSSDEAAKATIKSVIGDDVESFLAGGLSGAGMSGVYHGSNAVARNSLKASIGNDIISSGQANILAQNVLNDGQMTEDKKLLKLAKQTAEIQNNKYKAKKVGSLYDLALQKADEQFKSQSNSNVKSAVENRLKALGVDETAAVHISDAVIKSENGEKLNFDEKQLLKSSAASKVMSEMHNANESEFTNDWVSGIEQADYKGNSLLAARTTSDEVRNAVVSGTEINHEAKTKAAYTGEIQKILSIAENKTTVELKDGRVVNAALNFENAATGELYNRAIRTGDVKFVNTVKEMYNDGYNINENMTAAERLYNSGRAGTDFDGLYKANSIVSSVFTKRQAEVLYNIGAESNKTLLKSIVRIYSADDLIKAQRHGGVVKNYTLANDKYQKETIDFLDAFGKKYKTAIVVCDTIDGGRSNGAYDRKNNTVYVALDAKNGAVLSALGHEMYHKIANGSKAAAKELRDFVMSELKSRKDFDYDKTIEEYGNRYNKDKTKDIAFLEEEIVADSMFDVFNEKSVKRLVKEHRTLAQRIKDILDDFLDFLTGRSKDFTSLSKHFDEKALKKISDMFFEALESISESTQKNNTRNWLAVNRLKLPLPNFQYGFLDTIKSQKDKGVNSSISEKVADDTKNINEIKRSVNDFELKTYDNEIEKIYGEYNGFSIKSLLKIAKVAQELKESGKEIIVNYYHDDFSEALKDYFPSGYILEVIASDLCHKMYNHNITQDDIKEKTFYRIGEPRFNEYNGEYYPSYNYADDIREIGVSIVTPEWLDSIKSVFFGAHNNDTIRARGVYEIKGVELSKGGDGEPLIYPTGYAYKTNIKSYARLRKVVESTATAEKVENKDVKFSLNDKVEETKDLVAVHNMTVENLKKSIELGGLPMPSIAVIKAQSGHSRYGDVSLVFGKETIDPKLLKSNKIYGGDAWTPTYPIVESKINESVLNNIRDRVLKLVDDVPEYKAKAHNMLEETNVEDRIRYSGENKIAKKYSADSELKYAYIKDKGIKFSPVTKEREYSQYIDNASVKKIVDVLGKDKIKAIVNGEEKASTVEKTVRDIVNEYIKKKYSGNRFLDKMFEEELSFGKLDSIIYSAYNMTKGGASDTVIDTHATDDLMKKIVNQEDYESWVTELFKGIVEKKGIRNNKDYFTPMGNRRSFEALHYEENLENVVKAMKDELNGDGTLFSGMGIWGVSAKEYGSIEEVRSDKSRLVKTDQEEYNKIKEGYGARLTEIAKSIMDKTENNEFIALDNAMNCIVNSIRNAKTKSGLFNSLKQYSQLSVTSYTVDDIVSLTSDISNMPTEYFEAKPQRAVGFDEVKAVIVPDSIDGELKAKLDDGGLNVIEYEQGNEQSRLEKLNSIDEVRFSRNVDSFNENEYKQVELPRREYAMVMSAIATQDGEYKQSGTVRKIYAYDSSYLYTYQNDRPIIIEKAKINNIHKEDYNVYGNRKRPAGLFEQAESNNRNGRNGNIIRQNRSSAGRNDTNVSRQIQEQGQSDGARHSENGDNADSEKESELRKSLNDTKTVDELIKENVRLNEALCLAKQELTLTQGHKLNEKQIKSLATGILRKTSSSYSLDTLSKNLTKVFEYIANDKQPSFDIAIDAIADISKAVISESGMYNKTLYNQYADMRKYFRETNIKLSDTAKEEITDYNDFRRRNFGRINLKNDGTELDVLWGEISEMYPEFFPADAHEAEQILLIEDALDTVNPYYENPFGYDTDEAAYDLAADIYDKYFNIAEIHTFADKKKAQMTRLRAEYNQKLRDKHIADRNDYQNRLKEARATYQKRLKNIRTYNNVKIKEIQAANATRRIAARNRRIETDNKQRLRRQVIKKTKRLTNMLVKPTEKKHIPENLKSAVLEFSKSMTETGIFTFERMARLQDAYNAVEQTINSNKDYDLYSFYDNGISESITELKETLNNRRLSELDLSELASLKNIVENINNMVSNENKLFCESKKQSVEENGQAAIDELELKGKVKRLDILNNKAAVGAKNVLIYGNMKPVYFFKYLGGTMQEMFKSIEKAEDIYARSINSSHEYFKKIADKYNYVDWCDNSEHTKKKIEFKTERGKTIKMTAEEAMSLYATIKRKQGVEHLKAGGFKFYHDEITTEKKLKVIPVKYVEKQTEAIQLTVNDMQEVSSLLSEDQKGFADEMIKYLSTDMAALGNEVSLKLYGYKKFNETNYFPITSANEYLGNKKASIESDARIKHKSFTNTTVPGANNPVMISPFCDVWGRHCNDMATYNAFALPIEDFYRVYNYKTKADENLQIASVQNALKNAYGVSAAKYIDTLMTDLNGGVTHQAGSEFTNAWISRFKKGAVFASSSVAIQQPSAVARALALVDAKYFAKTTFSSRTSKTYDELKKYAPVGIIKEMGYFDTSMGRAAADWITDREYKKVIDRNNSFEEMLEAFKEKGAAFFDMHDSAYRDEFFSWLPGKMDEITWCHIWNAVKNETADKHPELSGEELLQRAGERFTEVIHKTQVYDSVLSRSQNMRSKSDVMKMATAFMAEPTTSLNMLADAVMSGKSGDKKYMIRALGAVVASYALNAALVAIVYAARDDDDEPYTEKYLVNLISNFLQNINPLNLIPWVKDIWTLFNGYDVERADMNLINDLADSFLSLFSTTKTTEQKVSGFVGSIANLCGLPFKNVYRDVKAVFNVISGADNDKEVTASGVINGVKGEYSRGLLGELLPAKNEYEQYYDAVIDKNEKTAEKTHSNILEDGKTEKDFNSGISKALQDDKRVQQAAQAKIDGNMQKYEKLLNEVTADGFSESNVVNAINSYKRKLEKNGKDDEKADGKTSKSDNTTKKSSENEVEPEESIYSTADVAVCINNNNITGAQKCIDDIYEHKVEYYLAKGKTKTEAQSQARSSIKSSLTREYKESYISSSNQEKLALQNKLFRLHVPGTGHQMYSLKDDFNKWTEE